MTLDEKITELVATLGCSRKEARKLLMRSGANRSTGDGISRLTHSDPTPVAALRNIERSSRRNKE